MNDNWHEILKNKTDKELYQTYLGKTHFYAIAREKAEEELKSRNFDFNNIEEYKKKWELEELIEEERNKNIFFRVHSSNSQDFKMMLIFGFIFTIIGILNLMFDFLKSQDNEYPLTDKLGLVLIGVIALIVGTIGFKRMKKKEIKRKNRIDELIREL